MSRTGTPSEAQNSGASGASTQARASSPESIDYADIYERTPVAQLVLARNSKIQLINQRGARLLGLAPEQLRGQRFDALLSAQFQPEFAGFLHRVFTYPEGAICKVALRQDPGKPTLFVQIEAVSDAEQQTCNAVMIDVSAREAAEAMAQKNVDLLASFGTHIPGILFQYRLDPDGSTHFPYVSEAIRKMYGVSTQQACTDSSLLARFVHPEDAAALEASMHQSASSLAPWRHEFRMLQADGTTIWRALDARPEKLANGSVLWHGYTIDITDRKCMEEALRQSEERWKLALEGAGDGVWDWNVQSESLTYSSRWKEMFGYTEDEISNLPEEWVARVHPEDVPIAAANRQRLLDGTTTLSTIELRMRSRDGRWKWILSRGIVVSRDASGKPLRVVGTNTDITERKHMEEALRESEERWKFALEGAGDAVWDLNAQTGAVVFSTRWKVMLGYAEEDIPNLPGEWSKLIHPEDLPAAAATRQMLQDGEKTTTSTEMRMRCKDGSWKWILSRGMVVSHGDNGKPLRIVGTNSDITERKRMEETLRENEERWKLALEGAGHGVWDWDLQTGTALFSKRWAEILGYAEHEIGNDANEWISRAHPEDMPRIFESQQAIFAEQRNSDSVEFRMLCKDGNWRWMLGSGILVKRDESGRAVRMVGTISDISERKRVEEALRVSEERWKFALEGAGDGVWDWDVQREEITFSRRGQEILGHAELDIPKDYDEWYSRIHPDDAPRAQENRGMLLGEVKDTSSNEVRMRCKDGGWKWVHSRGMVARRDATGKPLRLVGTLSDITQRKQMEEALRLTLVELEERRREAEQHSEAKTRFLNAASHDLRQPLYATQLFADAIAEEPLTPQQQEIMQNLQRSIGAMSAQLQMLLDVSRLDMGNFKPQIRDISVSDICRNLETTYAPIARNAGVALRFLPGSGVVRSDAVLIVRLLGNLIDNAIKFAQGGSVLVCGRRTASGVRIEVRDNGPGIEPEHRQQIFDEYYQINNPARNPNVGLGLGLSIAQRISRLLDAPLSLQTRVGQGTIFAITLPTNAPTPTHPQHKKSESGA